MKKWIWLGIGTGIAVAALLIGLLAPRPLLKVNNVRVYEAEVTVYLEIAARKFEEAAGDRVWAMRLEGEEMQAAAERSALESLLRAKILQAEAEWSSQEEIARLRDRLPQLKALLGEEWLKENGIGDEVLWTILQDQYLAACYEAGIDYDSETIGEELEAMTERAFGSYADAVGDGQLQKIRMDFILCAKGEWKNGEWLTYPESYREEKQEILRNVYRRLQAGEDFQSLKRQFSESQPEIESHLFACGLGLVPDEAGYRFREELHDSIDSQIFRIEEGSFGPVMDTPYAYLIVWVEDYAEPSPAEIAAFRERLAEAREEFQEKQVQELRRSSIETETERLKSEAEVQIWEKRWSKVLQRFWEKRMS